jgi:hypothetical protein
LAVSVSIWTVGVVSARAGVLDPTPTCNNDGASSAFSRWLDPFQYLLVPNGGFERALMQWTTDGPAALTSDNESYYVAGANDRASLSLDPGASATTAPVCAALDRPTLRFFVRNRGGVTRGLRVEALTSDGRGGVQSVLIGLLTSGEAWSPSPPLAVLANLLPVIDSEHAVIAFRFTAVGPTCGSLPCDYRIDDVFLDPWRHG